VIREAPCQDGQKDFALAHQRPMIEFDQHQHRASLPTATTPKHMVDEGFNKSQCNESHQAQHNGEVEAGPQCVDQQRAHLACTASQPASQSAELAAEQRLAFATDLLLEQRRECRVLQEHLLVAPQHRLDQLLCAHSSYT
jgi:hypothetical protein